MERTRRTMLLTVLVIAIGCESGDQNEKLAHMAQEHVRSQAKQNKATVELQREVAKGTRELVAADDATVPVQVQLGDIKEIQIQQASLAVLNFTLQFIPPAQRVALLEQIFHGMLPGGALVLSEKICFEDAHKQKLITDWHHDFKQTQGYSDLEIAQKRNALENIMIPETLESHHARLSSIGFQQVCTWYQCFNFCSIIAIK